MRRKISVAVSAMVLAAQLGSPAVAQQPSLAQLSEIAALLDENDVGGLRTFLDANPDLLEGETPLSGLLRRFMTESSDVTNYLGLESDLNQMLEELSLREGGGFEPGAGGPDPDGPAAEGPDPDGGPAEEGPDPDEGGGGGGGQLY